MNMSGLGEIAGRVDEPVGNAWVVCKWDRTKRGNFKWSLSEKTGGWVDGWTGEKYVPGSSRSSGTGLGGRGRVRCIGYQVQNKQILQRADRPVLPDVWVSLWPRKPRQPFVPDNISSEFEFYTCQCFMSGQPAVAAFCREGERKGL